MQYQKTTKMDKIPCMYIVKLYEKLYVSRPYTCTKVKNICMTCKQFDKCISIYRRFCIFLSEGYNPDKWNQSKECYGEVVLFSILNGMIMTLVYSLSVTIQMEATEQ